MSELDIGILALQGDVAENFVSTMMAMNELGIDGSVSQVNTPDQMSAVDGLIVPGGESTMMGQLSMVKILRTELLVLRNNHCLTYLMWRLSAIPLADRKIPLRLKFPWMLWTYHHFRACLFAHQL